MPLILSGNTGTSTLDSSNGLTFSDSSLQGAAASPFVLKNRIINGAMQIFQRSSTATNSGTSYSNSYSTVDRYQIYRDGAVTGCNPSTGLSGGPTGLPYFARIQRASGNTATNPLNFAQTIESINCYDLAGQSVTLSFWARAGANYSSTSNSLVATIVSGTGTDGNLYNGLTGFAITANTTATLTTSWQRFTVTGTVASNANQVGMFMQSAPTGTAGANDYFDVTGVQLELGTSATPFERRLYGQELVNCQRYCEVVQPSGLTTFATIAIGQCGSSTIGTAVYYYQVAKRTQPTVTYDTASKYGLTNSANSTLALTAISTDRSDITALAISCTVASGLVAGNATRLLDNNTSYPKTIISAEL